MNAHNLRSWRVLPGLVIVASLLLSGAAMAGAPETGPTTPQTGPAAPAGTEDGGGVDIRDVGGEYPSEIPPAGDPCTPRPIHKTSVWNFYNAMRGAGYTGGHDFIFGNSLAWETDLKRAALGGSENSWIDNVDIFFLHSHGSVGSICFPWDHTDDDLVPGDCSGSWGTKDVEWIGIKTCLSLADLNFAGCMNGVHTIAGFTTGSASNEFGGHWADQLLGWKMWFPFIGDIWLRSPKTVTQAWFDTCDTQTDGATARVIAEDWRDFDDKVWTRGGPVRNDANFVVDWPKWYIDHNCYKPRPKAVDVSLLAEMPSQVVMPRTVNQDFASSLAATLSVSGTLALSSDGQEYSVTDTSGGMTRTLTIQTATGGYVYQDTSQLWVPPEPGQPLNLPDPTEAADLATAYFLANASALPGGTNFDSTTQHVATDQMTAFSAPGATGASVTSAPEGVDVMVAYGRSLATTATTARGAAVAVNVSVGGPGGGTKLYLGGQGDAPIGLSGGPRDVQAGNPVTLKDVGATWDAFEDDPQLSVLDPGIAYDSMVRHPELDTFAYFEQPLDVSQKELIPTWAYNVDFVKGGQVTANGTVYVPASADYYPPGVAIDNPKPDDRIVAGQRIALNATTTGGNGPFTYEWSSSSQGVLGTAEDITAMLLSQSKPGEAPTQVTLTLRVTDVNGLYRTAEINVNVVGQPAWLPLIMK